MSGRLTESTEALLEAFQADFQRQLRHSAVVERLVVNEPDGGRVTLTAIVRVAAQEIEVSGTGTNLVTAYASLARTQPELILASAYRQVLDQALRT